MTKVFEPRTAVFTPGETSTYGVERIRQMEAMKHRAMPLDVEKIGAYLAPLMPGEICAVQAQTSNYKSGFMNMWEHMLAHHLQASGREDEIVVHIDTETTIEGLSIQEIARDSNHTVADLSRGNVHDWGRVIQAATKIAGVNIYRIGTALGREDMPDLYLSNVYRAIRYMASGDLLGRPLQPACIFVDYLQALPIDPEVKKGSPELKHQRRLQVREDVYRLRQMAAHFNCPVVVGVQAKQALTGNISSTMLIPGMYDGEETSSIAQRFDRIISMWMPKTTHLAGDVLNHKNLSFEVEENMLWVRVLKQRGGLPSGSVWKCEIDFHRNTIKPC